MFKIYTLGNFDIKHNDKSILETKGYPYKTLKLFKYFLTHEGKKLLPENIIEDLWEDNEYRDPSGVLRTQISRVRKMIDLDKLRIEKFFQIKYVNGYYTFNLENIIQRLKERFKQERKNDKVILNIKYKKI